MLNNIKANPKRQTHTSIHIEKAEKIQITEKTQQKQERDANDKNNENTQTQTSHNEKQRHTSTKDTQHDCKKITSSGIKKDWVQSTLMDTKSAIKKI